MKKGLSNLALGRIAAFTTKRSVADDQIPGGYGDESMPSEHCLKQVYKGIQVEMEHTDDPDLALEIALDHLVEFPDYYSRLSDMEDQAKAEGDGGESDEGRRGRRGLMKLHGITAAGMKRIAKFMAEPPIPSSEQYGGVVEYPGFHTTGSMEIAASYAVGRVNASYTEQGADGEYFVTDYPVVVALDMSGYSPQTDYDAEKMVWDMMEAHLGELINAGLTVESSDEEILDALSDLLSYGDREIEADPDDPYGLIGEESFYHFNDPLRLFEDDPEFPYILRQYMQTGAFPQDRLMQATDQYRYTEDVEESRVVAVYYVTPVATEIEDELTEETEGGVEALQSRWPGFDIPCRDDLYGGSYGFGMNLVWGSEEGFQPAFQQLTMPWVAPSTGQVEYHGTTYKRLLEAAPSLAAQIPEPPDPPYAGGS